MIFAAVDEVRGRTSEKKSRKPVLAVLAVVVLAAAFLLFGPLRPGRNQTETPAASTAAETEALTENNAAETEAASAADDQAADSASDDQTADSVSDAQAETSSASASAQDGQILPEDFLLHMEELAQEKIQTLTTDTGYITIKTDNGDFDIDSRYVSISDAVMSKEAVFTETGGTTGFYICFEADVQIDESWSGFAGPNPPESSYQDAAIVFELDTFPYKFIDKDGNMNYSDQDFQFSKIYTSITDFEVLLHQDLQYVDHDYYKIDLP